MKAFDIQDGIAKTINHLDLSRDQMSTVMRQIMTGNATEAQIGGFLVALRMKSEAIDEIVGAAATMRELALPVDFDNREYLVDIVGTGGDGANLFNVSTAAAMVAAAAGARVAKHGGGSVSSSSGAADLWQALGLRLDLSPAQINACVNDIGIGFMFAPAHHSAMKYATAVRRQLGQRTIFNILGPMTNPGRVANQVLGAFNSALCRPLAEAMAQLGSEHLLVISSSDGLDEISLATTTHVAELKNGAIREYTITPEDLGIASQSLLGLSVSSSSESLALIKGAFGMDNDIDPKRRQKAVDMIALNAGAAIYAAGVEVELKAAVALAKNTIQIGKALEKMQQLVEYSRNLK